MSDLVGNPEDRFSHNEAQLYNVGGFRIFEIKLFCFVSAMGDLVHDVEAILYLPKLFTASGNLF